MHDMHSHQGPAYTIFVSLHGVSYETRTMYKKDPSNQPIEPSQRPWVRSYYLGVITVCSCHFAFFGRWGTDMYPCYTDVYMRSNPLCA